MNKRWFTEDSRAMRAAKERSQRDSINAGGRIIRLPTKYHAAPHEHISIEELVKQCELKLINGKVHQ